MFKLFSIIILCLSSCISKLPIEEDIILKQENFENLPEFWNDDLTDFWTSFTKSCDKFISLPKNHIMKIGNKYNAGSMHVWRPICYKLNNVDSSKYHDFIYNEFNLYRVTSSKGNMGLFTGYYEIDLNGHTQKTKQYKYPIYAMPKHQDQTIHTREEIEQGALSGQSLEILWVDDYVDLFFMHIQGSGRIHLKNGEVVRLGYAGKNIHPYNSIGKILIEQGYMDKKSISAFSIKTWLKHHPEKAKSIMHQNPSYIFFRIIEVDDGPIGAQGVELTGGRSIAIDKKFIPLGIPIFLKTEISESPYIKSREFSRLMVAQDTGSAIKGAIRGDIFFGHGKHAEMLAGYMKSKGYYYILIPKSININDI